MGVRSGPKLPNTDNLVLCLDAFNTKSYAGEVGTDVNLNTPTANVHDYTGTSYGSLTEWSSDTTVFTKTYDATIRTPLNDGYGATIISESGSNGYHHLSRFGGSNPDEGSYNHMVSFYFKPISNEITNFRVGMLGDSSNGGCQFNFVTGEVTAIGSSSGKVIIFEQLSDGWWFCACDFNGRNGGWVGAIGLQPYSAYTGVAGRRKAYICGLQYSNKSYPTAYGDRSATDGWRDISGKGNHGTLTNMLGTATTHYKNFNVMLPTTNAYLDFDGSDDYVTLGTPEILNFSGGTSPTVAAWINTSSSAEAQILRTRQSTKYLIFGIHSGKLRAQIYDGTNNANDQNNNGPTINDGNWHHVAAVFNRGGNIIFYKDGVATTGISMASVTGETGTPDPYAAIGQRPAADGGSQFYDGKIACMQIYNRALSHANIKQIYNSQKSRFGL